MMDHLDWKVFGILALCLIVLVFYLIRRNMKDKKNITKFLNQVRGRKHNVNDEDEI